MVQAFLILGLVIVTYFLFSAFYYLIKPQAEQKKMLKLLSWRIGISMALFLFILLAYLLGWVQPHRLP